MLSASSRRLTDRLGRAEGTLKRMVRNAANDAAFELKRETPDYLKETLENPTRFTVSPSVARVKKATTSVSSSVDSVAAEVSVSPIQAKYLSVQEFGLEAENLNDPVASATDKFGNTKARFRRTGTALQRLKSATFTRKGVRLPRFFVGVPQGRPGAVAGIYERYNRGRGLRLMTAFVKRRRYKPKLGLRDFWTTEGTKRLRSAFERERRDPRNKL